MIKLDLPHPLEYIIDNDDFEVLAGPLDPRDEEGFAEEAINILRQNPWEERDLGVLVIDQDGSAYTQEIEEDYMGWLEDEAWAGLTPGDDYDEM